MPRSQYEWPPLPVLDTEEATRLLVAGLRAAWDDLEEERLRVLLDPKMLRKRAVDQWLKEFQAAIETFQADVRYHLERFVTLHLSATYMVGVQAAGGAAVWTAMHQTAFVSLATDTYADFLRRSQEAEQTADDFARAVRAAAREEVPKTAAGGRTVLQAARRFEDRLVGQYDITHVTYSNGTRVPVDVYTQMAARTKSAVAYNSGSLNEYSAMGGQYVEVMDGFDCGWAFHADTDKANGTIRHIKDAAAHPISHPQCKRAFAPRPDITSMDAAAAAKPSTTAEQREDQASVDWTEERQRTRDRARASRRDVINARRAERQQAARDAFA